MTTIQLQNKKNFATINNLKDLQREIARRKIVVSQRENRLRELAQKIPEEATFATVSGVIHALSKKGVPSNIFNLVRNGIGLIINIRRRKRGLQGLISQGKELVLYAVFNQLLRLYQQKRTQRKLTSE